MASLPKLREAKSLLGLDANNQHLRLLALNQGARTEIEIVNVLRDAGQTASPAEIESLLRIVETANETEPNVDHSGERSLESQSSGQPEVNEKHVSDVEIADEEDLDEEDYLAIDILAADKAKLGNLKITSNGDTSSVSWKGLKGSSIVYVLASGETDFPRVVKGSRESWATRSTELVIDSRHNLLSLFAFDGPGTKGKLVARGRVLGEVFFQDIQEHEDQIRLMWTTNDKLSQVRLYRSKPDQPLPEHLNSSYQLKIADGSDSFIDLDVKPGQQFEYKVSLEWQSPDGKVITSPGDLRRIIVPGSLSDVTGFQVTVSPDNPTHVDIEFDAVQQGQVKIFQIEGAPSAELLRESAGQRDVEVEQLLSDYVKTWLGTEVIDTAVNEDGKVRIKNVPMLVGGLGSRTYTAVGILGKNARICDVKVIQRVGKITQASIVDRFDYQLLRVGLPEGADALEIWRKAPGAAMADGSNLGTPDRVVQIDTEYRRFGGVLFANNVPGLSTVVRLDGEPLSIWVRGISVYKGDKHEGPLHEVQYPGRISIGYRRSGVQSATNAPKRKGLWGRLTGDEGTNVSFQGTNALEIVAQAPMLLASHDITLQHLEAEEYPLDSGSKGARNRDFIQIRPVDYVRSSEVKQRRPDGSYAPVTLTPNLQFRVADAGTSSNLPPIFTLNAAIPNSEGLDFEAAKSNNASLKVVLIGAKQSGKTTYVQALLNYFEQQLSQLLAAKLIPEHDGDPAAIRRLEQMRTFVKTGELPQATRSASQFKSSAGAGVKDANDPTQHFSFKFFNGGDVALSKVDIVDVAGEDMDRLETMRLYENALIGADLLVFLMDPLQVPAVRTAMKGSPLPPQGTDPFTVLQHLHTILDGAGDRRKADQMLAITMSKFDAFEDLSNLPGNPMSGKVQRGMQVTRDPNSNSKWIYNRPDGELAEKEILAILENVSFAHFRGLAANIFKDKPELLRYFVVSSLGHSTHAAELDSAGITSFRVSDPIRWALSRRISRS